MRLQQTVTHKAIYSFETEDFEQWQLGSLNLEDDADEYESAFDEEALAGNVIEFLHETAAD